MNYPELVITILLTSLIRTSSSYKYIISHVFLVCLRSVPTAKRYSTALQSSRLWLQIRLVTVSVGLVFTGNRSYAINPRLIPHPV